MAKPFYSMQEVCEKLGKTEDEIKALVREGRLREFRDAGKVFFKAEDVDKLAGGEPSGGDEAPEIELEPALDELPSLTDESGGGTSVLGLAPLDEEGGEEPKEDTVVPPSGIGVFDEDEMELDADPMAKTQVTAAAGGDQVSLEGTGSGSGLLDLTREADDTSLGAELLDEIYPGEEAEAATPPAPPTAVEEAPEPVAEAEEEAPVELPAAPAPAPAAAAVAADPTEGLFDGLLAGTAILLAASGSVVAAVLQGFVPDYAVALANRIWILIGGAALVPVVAMLVGWLLGRFVGGRR